MTDDFVVQKMGLKSLLIFGKKDFENPDELTKGANVTINVSNGKGHSVMQQELGQSLGR